MYKLIGADDILSRGVTSFAQLRPVLTSNTDPLAANTTLRKDEWEQIDARVNAVMRQRLTIVNDLRGLGLVKPVSLGTILRVTERLSDFDDASVSFDGDTAPQRDRPNFQRDVIPVPVISKDFTLNWRQLSASRERGEPLDVTSAAVAARKVADKVQDLFANGFAGGPGANPASGTDGQSIPGLVNAANALTVSGSDWDSGTITIIADVIAMLKAAYAANLFGPFYLYVPKNYWGVIQDDYSTSKGDRTYLERIQAFADIAAVRPLDSLPDDNVVLVQMTEDVIDMTEAQAVTTVQWEKNPFVTNFRVLMVGGPHIKRLERQGGNTIHGIVRLL
jgi:uncharacterized linocin/CFP29 family protein